MSSDLRIRQSAVKGNIKIPGSKSHTIRAMIIAGLADGESVIRAPLLAGDTLSCLNGLEEMGINFVTKPGEHSLLKVKGSGGEFRESEKVINVGNSGTTLRILTAVGALSDKTIRFDGDDSIRKRPMQPLLSALYDIGAKVDSNSGHAPLSISGPLKGGKTMTDGISSQFLTALLLACPLADGDTEIDVIDLHEKPYIEMTLKWLDEQNIIYTNRNFEHFTIKGGQSYKPFSTTIPGDFSSATFPLIAAAVTGSKIKIEGLDFNDSQGDKRVFEIMDAMGASISHEKEGVVVAGAQLRGMELDLNDIPDALPALAIAGCAAEGETRLLNVEQARLKESDRIRSICVELRKMGAKIYELDHGLVIEKSQLTGTEVKGYGDHRIVMALSLAGMIASGETLIRDGADPIRITYPSFVEDFTKLGADISIIK
ncbi:MAG: 3-phosphoshikimate 1-carboxyvinyltransferase [Candidatus Aminicenantes bacterium]|nr:3-phosphoshikimate 1-carboxyvinyltransferase [Candidatus Aminicenantes bacterium]